MFLYFLYFLISLNRVAVKIIAIEWYIFGVILMICLTFQTIKKFITFTEKINIFILVYFTNFLLIVIYFIFIKNVFNHFNFLLMILYWIFILRNFLLYFHLLISFLFITIDISIYILFMKRAINRIESFIVSLFSSKTFAKWFITNCI